MSGYADNLVLKGEMYKENADISEQHHLYLNWMRCMILVDREYGVMGEHERSWVYNELKVFFCIISNEFITNIKICMKLDY